MWGLVAFLVGGLYGSLTPGLQNRDRVVQTGAAIGLGVAVVFWGLGALVESAPLGFGDGVWTGLLSILAMTLLFVLGVWLGDLLQRHRTTAN